MLKRRRLKRRALAVGGLGWALLFITIIIMIGCCPLCLAMPTSPLIGTVVLATTPSIIFKNSSLPVIIKSINSTHFNSTLNSTLFNSTTLNSRLLNPKFIGNSTLLNKRLNRNSTILIPELKQPLNFSCLTGNTSSSFINFYNNSYVNNYLNLSFNNSKNKNNNNNNNNNNKNNSMPYKNPKEINIINNVTEKFLNGNLNEIYNKRRRKILKKILISDNATTTAPTNSTQIHPLNSSNIKYDNNSSNSNNNNSSISSDNKNNNISIYHLTADKLKKLRTHDNLSSDFNNNSNNPSNIISTSTEWIPLSENSTITQSHILSRTERSVYNKDNISSASGERIGSKKRHKLNSNLDRNERSANFSGNPTKKIQLYIKNRFIQLMRDGTVNGTQDDLSDYTILQRTTVDIGQIKIQGVATCLYLCMDQCGIVYGAKIFSEDCVFNESMEQHHYNTYSSTYNSNARRTLYLALDRHGEPRKLQIPPTRSLGKLATYTKSLTETVPEERVENLIARTFGSNRVKHGLRQLCDAGKPLIPLTSDVMKNRPKCNPQINRSTHQSPVVTTITPQSGLNKFKLSNNNRNQNSHINSSNSNNNLNKKKKKKRRCRPDEPESELCHRGPQALRRKPIGLQNRTKCSNNNLSNKNNATDCQPKKNSGNVKKRHDGQKHNGPHKEKKKANANNKVIKFRTTTPMSRYYTTTIQPTTTIVQAHTTSTAIYSHLTSHNHRFEEMDEEIAEDENNNSDEDLGALSGGHTQSLINNGFDYDYLNDV